MWFFPRYYPIGVSGYDLLCIMSPLSHRKYDPIQIFLLSIEMITVICELNVSSDDVYCLSKCLQKQHRQLALQISKSNGLASLGFL